MATSNDVGQPEPDPLVKVAHCGNLTCTAGNTLTTLNCCATPSSIAIGADGLPIVSYFGGAIKHCGNITCTASNTGTTLDRADTFGHETSIAIGTDGLPVVSYAPNDNRGNPNNTDLQVAHCSDVTCTAGYTLTSWRPTHCTPSALNTASTGSA